LELYIGSQTVGGGIGVAAGVGVEMMNDARHWHHEDRPLVLGDTICLRLRKPPVLAPGEEPVVVEDD